MAELDILIEKLAVTTVEDAGVDLVSFAGEGLKSDVEEDVKVDSVSFAGKGLKLDTEEDAAEIVQAINNCSNMTTLCLEGNTVGVSAAKAIGKALESQTKFKRALWKDMFTQRREHEIPEALFNLSSGIRSANAQLVELDLSDNAFGPRGLKGIVDLLKSPSCYTLHELRLNNNGLGVSGAKMLALALSECLISSCKAGCPLSLKVFVCGRNRLENDGCAAISAVLKDIGTLEHIAMPQNGIYHEGIQSLSENLIGNSYLKVLNLEDNCFTKEGAEEMAKSLPSFERIEILNFGDCLIRSDGAKLIAEALKENCPMLKELYMGYNEMNVESGKEIILALVDKKNLEKLVLNGNQFGEKGCELIMKLVEDIGKLSQLDSLSDDEGSDRSDEEENDYQNEDNNEDIKNLSEYSSFNYQAKMASLDFIGKPTTEKLVELHELQISLLDELPEQLSAAECFELFITLCEIIDSEDEKVLAAAHYLVDDILSCAFKNTSELEMWKFNSDFLVYLGLVKREDKNIRTLENQTGAITLLHHAGKQNYFHNSTKELLKFFLTKPNKWENVDSEVKVQLINSFNEDD